MKELNGFNSPKNQVVNFHKHECLYILSEFCSFHMGAFLAESVNLAFQCPWRNDGGFSSTLPLPYIFWLWASLKNIYLRKKKQLFFLKKKRTSGKAKSSSMWTFPPFSLIIFYNYCTILLFFLAHYIEVTQNPPTQWASHT